MHETEANAAHPTESCGWRIGFDRSGAPPSQLLPGRLRAARAVAGLGFLAIAGSVGRSGVGIPVSFIALWLGASHLVAAGTGYRGCPELGAIPSLVLGRHVATVCGPWGRIDRLLERTR